MAAFKDLKLDKWYPGTRPLESWLRDVGIHMGAANIPAAKRAPYVYMALDDDVKEHVQGWMLLEVPPALVENCTVEQLRDFILATPAGVRPSYAQQLAQLEKVTCDGVHMSAYNDKFNKLLQPIQNSGTPLPLVTVCYMYGTEGLPAPLFGATIKEAGEDWTDLQAYQTAATKKATALRDHDPNVFAKRKRDDREERMAKRDSTAPAKKKFKGRRDRSVDADLAKETARISLNDKAGHSGRRQRGGQQRGGQGTGKGRRANKDRKEPPGPCSLCDQDDSTPKREWHWKRNCPTHGNPPHLNQAYPGGLPVLGPVSSSPLPACSAAPTPLLCNPGKDPIVSSGAASSSSLSYTAEHLLAMAMIPPSANTTAAAPITTLHYPEYPEFNPAEYCSVMADGPDPVLERLHWLQHDFHRDVAHTHPALWACLQHIIQHHQQHFQATPAQVKDVESALAAARQTALQHRCTSASVNRDTLHPQTDMLSFDMPSSGGMQAGSEDPSPPKAAEALNPYSHMAQGSAEHNDSSNCNSEPVIPRGGEPPVFKYVRNLKAQKVHSAPCHPSVCNHLSCIGSRAQAVCSALWIPHDLSMHRVVSCIPMPRVRH
jgi:hypothetical protein